MVYTNETQQEWINEPPTGFPFRKNITYTLNIPDQDIIENSIGGFLIGEGGSKIKNFLFPINEQHKTPNKQFLRIRALGKLNFVKNSKDSFKRNGDSRVELCFNIVDEQSLRAVVKIAKRFENEILNDTMKYYEYIKIKKEEKIEVLSNSSNKKINK